MIEQYPYGGKMVEKELTSNDLNEPSKSTYENVLRSSDYYRFYAVFVNAHFRALRYWAKYYGSLFYVNT
jgi:hypothetical protein